MDGGTYRGDGLHAQDEGIRGQIARIRERVFLPELTKQILGDHHAGMVVGEVALEEQVDGAGCERSCQ